MQPELIPFARRLVPARPDLAAAHLEGRVAAERFESGVECFVTAPLLDLVMTPDPDAGLATQLLLGERFTVYEDRGDGLAWGQSGWDDYVGYVASAGLAMAGSSVLAERRRVTACASHIYVRPELKAPVRSSVPALAEVPVVEVREEFVALAGGGFMPRAHFAAVPGDIVDHARRFLGAPYLWGGRSRQGVDCSALVQLANRAAGHRGVPRDSDMQEAWVGDALALDETPRRGDLVFWKGHVGICTGSGGLIHANAHHMQVAEEPLAEAAERIEKTGGGPVTGLRRPFPE